MMTSADERRAARKRMADEAEAGRERQLFLDRETDLYLASRDHPPTVEIRAMWSRFDRVVARHGPFISRGFRWSRNAAGETFALRMDDRMANRARRDAIRPTGHEYHKRKREREAITTGEGDRERH